MENLAEYLTKKKELDTFETNVKKKVLKAYGKNPDYFNLWALRLTVHKGDFIVHTAELNYPFPCDVVFGEQGKEAV